MDDTQQQIVPVPPCQYALIKRCANAGEAVDMARQNLRTHPNEILEIWPVPESEERIVVRELMEEKHDH